MLEEESPFQIEVMPKIEGFWCKIAVYSIYALIIIFPFLLGIFFYYYLHNLWIGFSLFLFSLLCSIIVLSKMRIASIPFSQREMNYTTLAIVKWYIGKNICIKEDK